MTHSKLQEGVSLSVLFAAILGLDQFVKHLSVVYLRPIGTYPLIPGVFQLTYRENTGVAFSLFSGRVLLLSVITLIILFILLVFLLRGHVAHPVARCAVVFVLAGGAGNLVDRLFRGAVVDLFDFCWINFPVFNVADIFVTCGCVLFLVVFLCTKGEAIR